MAEQRIAGEVRVKLIPELADDGDFRHTTRPMPIGPDRGNALFEQAATRLEQAAAAMQSAASRQALAASNVAAFGSNARPDVIRAAELIGAGDRLPLSTLRSEFGLSDEQARRTVRQASRPLLGPPISRSNTMSKEQSAGRVTLDVDLNLLSDSLPGADVHANPHTPMPGRAMYAAAMEMSAAQQRVQSIMQGNAFAEARRAGGLPPIVTPDVAFARDQITAGARDVPSMMQREFGLAPEQARRSIRDAAKLMPQGPRDAMEYFSNLSTGQMSGGGGIGGGSVVDVNGALEGLNRVEAKLANIRAQAERPVRISIDDNGFTGGAVGGLRPVDAMTGAAMQAERQRQLTPPSPAEMHAAGRGAFGYNDMGVTQRSLPGVDARGGGRIPPFVDAPFTATGGSGPDRRSGRSHTTFDADWARTSGGGVDVGGGNGGGDGPRWPHAGMDYPEGDEFGRSGRQLVKRGPIDVNIPNRGRISQRQPVNKGLLGTQVMPQSVFFAGFFGAVEAAGAYVSQQDQYARGAAFAPNSMERLDSDLAAVDAVSGGFMGAVADFASRPYQNAMGIDRAGTESRRADALRIEAKRQLTTERDAFRTDLGNQAEIAGLRGFGREQALIRQGFDANLCDAKTGQATATALDAEGIRAMESDLEKTRPDRAREDLETRYARINGNGSGQVYYRIDGELVSSQKAEAAAVARLEVDDRTTVASERERQRMERQRQIGFDTAAAAEARDANLYNLYREVNRSSTDRIRGALAMSGDDLDRLNARQQSERAAMSDATEGLPTLTRMYARGSLGIQQFAERNAFGNQLSDQSANIRGQMVGMQARLDRDPFGGGMADLAEQRRLALGTVPQGSPGILGMAASGLRNDTGGMFDLQGQQLTQDRGDLLRNMEGETAVLNRLRSRDNRGAALKGLDLELQAELDTFGGDADLARRATQRYDARRGLMQDGFADDDARFQQSIGLANAQLDATIGGRGMESQLLGQLAPFQQQALQLTQAGRFGQSQQVLDLAGKQLKAAEADHFDSLRGVQVSSFDALEAPGRSFGDAITAANKALQNASNSNVANAGSSVFGNIASGAASAAGSNPNGTGNSDPKRLEQLLERVVTLLENALPG